ncbi:protein EPIDERMAL PATTERNING FACTOR 2 isoform X2 [Nymphaea colorata]|uniref:protein EPIDERMAL PATTERNING FACTOR 2 isoform X2 n=1 Tax=Nymphaea colorata TaxID=210225 RepID=UPI00129E44C7|nr:protein EPIDERMAL PATTERNING FACTOR 2 isoform X2 [Nymphaea colorata]
MKNFFFFFFFFFISSFSATTLVVSVLLGLTVGDATARVMHYVDGPHRLTRDTNLALEEGKMEKGVAAAAVLEDDPTGSSLPDCSHACGACFPCKRVTVSFKCSTTEPCPVVYRCLCKGRFFHVPST